MPGDPAVFIDRDGTLTEEVGYVNHPRRLRLLPRSAEAIRRLNRSGFRAVMVTNQSGVARAAALPFTYEAQARVFAEVYRSLGAR